MIWQFCCVYSRYVETGGQQKTTTAWVLSKPPNLCTYFSLYCVKLLLGLFDFTLSGLCGIMLIARVHVLARAYRTYECIIKVAHDICLCRMI